MITREARATEGTSLPPQKKLLMTKCFSKPEAKPINGSNRANHIKLFIASLWVNKIERFSMQRTSSLI
jgi:hypothetical protein